MFKKFYPLFQYFYTFLKKKKNESIFCRTGVGILVNRIVFLLQLKKDKTRICRNTLAAYMQSPFLEKHELRNLQARVPGHFPVDRLQERQCSVVSVAEGHEKTKWACLFSGLKDTGVQVFCAAFYRPVLETVCSQRTPTPA